MSAAWSHRRCVVAGAGRNVGQAVATELVDRGATVAVVDLDRDRAERVAGEIDARRAGSAVALAADVTSAADVQSLVARAWDRLGHVDTLVNAVAATDRPTDVLTLPDDRWDQVLLATLTAAFLTTKYVGKRMVADGVTGSIVHIGSTSGLAARTNAVAYPAAKAGLYGLVRSAAAQLGPHGIRVNTVTPNKVGSPVGEDVEKADRAVRNLLGRACTPDDVARAVAFIASEDAGFVTGTDLLVDGGASIATRD